MGVTLGPVVWGLVAGYWLVLRPRLVARGLVTTAPGPRRGVQLGLEVGLSMILAGLGGWLATDVFPPGNV